MKINHASSTQFSVPEMIVAPRRAVAKMSSPVVLVVAVLLNICAGSVCAEEKDDEKVGKLVRETEQLILRGKASVAPQSGPADSALHRVEAWGLSPSKGVVRGDVDSKRHAKEFQQFVNHAPIEIIRRDMPGSLPVVASWLLTATDCEGEIARGLREKHPSSGALVMLASSPGNPGNFTGPAVRMEFSDSAGEPGCSRKFWVPLPSRFYRSLDFGMTYDLVESDCGSMGWVIGPLSALESVKESVLQDITPAEMEERRVGVSVTYKRNIYTLTYSSYNYLEEQYYPGCPSPNVSAD